jgi:hypothetical protein
MKKIFIPLIVLIAGVASCKKSNSSSTPTNSLTASVSGTSKNFGVSATCLKVTQSGVTGIAIIGAVSLTTGEIIDMSMDNSLSGDSIVAGTYSDTSSHFDLDLEYDPSSTGNSYEGGTDFDGFLSGTGAVVTNHVKLVISAISSTRISGTFSGNIYLNGDPNATPVPIASGSFDLPIQTQ